MMRTNLSQAVLYLVLSLTVVVPLGFAQYDPSSLFQFSRQWQQPVNETGFGFDLYPDARIDANDLLLLIEGWHGVPSLEVSFIALPSGGPAPLQVEFRYGDPLAESQITSWAWDLDGDDIVDSTESNPTYLYETLGSYSVTLTIEDVWGQQESHRENDLVVVRERVGTAVTANVIVVDNEPCLDFVSKTETELVLEQTCIPDTLVGVGSIVVGSHDGGYARRVLSITESGNQLTLQTENVALTEIFNNADISGLLVYTPEDLRRAGFKIREDGSAWKPFENIELHAGITVSGGLEFKPALDWDCRLDWNGVDYLRCVFIGTLSMSYEATIGVEASLDLPPQEVSLVKVSNWGWFQVGPVPVIIYSEFDIKAGAQASIEGNLSMSAGFSSATTVRFGAEYDRDDAEPWSGVTGLSLNTNRFGPEFDFNAGATARVYLKPEGKLRIYGILGPGAAVEPYLRGDLRFTPPQELTLSAGIDAEVGFSLVDLSAIGIDFDLGYTARFSGPVYVLGRWPLIPSTGEPASPAFDAAPASGPAPLTVQFTDRSDPGDGAITSWSWDFGDGRHSTMQNPSHVYQSPGTYRAQLRVEGTSGSADWSATKLISVQWPSKPPTVSSFSLNNGAPTTTSRVVTLNCVVTNNLIHYMASESSNFSGASWMVYSPPAQFVLSPGNGTKTVYFKASNADGESAPVSDTIELNESQGPPIITINLPGGVTMETVRIPAGSFLMGSNDDSIWSSCDPCEQPVHEVNIGYDFYMGRTEITQAQWLAVMASWPARAPRSTYGQGDDYPAYYISWDDCQNFISALNQLGQGTFRLPSEAEWEYACRAGTTTRFYFGDSDGCGIYCKDCAAGTLAGNRSDYMWYCGNNSPWGSKPVGGKLPNAFGLYDMHGNVWEWCQDYWHEGYDGVPVDGSAWESPTSSYRVARGGFWDSYAMNCRSANRPWSSPDDRRFLIGLRLVRAP